MKIVARKNSTTPGTLPKPENPKMIRVIQIKAQLSAFLNKVSVKGSDGIFFVETLLNS